MQKYHCLTYIYSIYVLIFICVPQCVCLSQNTASIAISQTYNNDLQSGERKAFDCCVTLSGTSLDSLFALNNILSYRFNLGVLFEKSNKYEGTRFIITDNDLYLENICKYPFNWTLDPYLSISMRTQITEATKFISNKAIKTAKLMDPVTYQETTGWAYAYNDSFNRAELRLGLSLQQIQSHKYTLLTDDYKTKYNEKYKSYKGLECIFIYISMINQSMYFNSKTTLFGNMDDLSKWDIRFENEFKINLWRALYLLFKFNVFYIEKQIKHIQILQSTRIGLISTF